VISALQKRADFRDFSLPAFIFLGLEGAGGSARAERDMAGGGRPTKGGETPQPVFLFQPRSESGEAGGRFPWRWVGGSAGRLRVCLRPRRPRRCRRVRLPLVLESYSRKIRSHFVLLLSQNCEKIINSVTDQDIFKFLSY